MKQGAVQQLVRRHGLQSLILMDDSVMHLEGMVAGARKAGVAREAITPFLVEEGQWQAYEAAQRKAAIVMCAAPITFRERTLLARVAEASDVIFRGGGGAGGGICTVVKWRQNEPLPHIGS